MNVNLNSTARTQNFDQLMQSLIRNVRPLRFQIRWLKYVLLFLISFGAQAQIETQLNAFSDSFISPAFEGAEDSNFYFFGASLRNLDSPRDSLKMNINGAIAAGAPLLNYLEVNEFYFQNQATQEETLWIGRKKFLWSDLDARWNLGIWEPVFKWNPLSPEREGLTGIFWRTENPDYSLTIFASPIFLPSQGPSFQIKDGKFVKGNPWFRDPPENIRIFDENTAIQYDLVKPQESKVVLQSSYGAQFSFGEQSVWAVSLSHIYKPSNTLAIGYDGYFSVPKDKGMVTIEPQVYYHQLSALDVYYNVSKIRLGWGFLYDRPNNEELFDEKWTQPVFDNAWLSSPYIEYRGDRWALTLQKLTIYGGETRDKGKLYRDGQASLTQPYPFRGANEVSLYSQWRLGGARSLKGQISYVQGDYNEFALFKTNVKFRFNSRIEGFAEIQLIDADVYDPQIPNELTQFSNNDRFMLGVTYAI